MPEGDGDAGAPPPMETPTSAGRSSGGVWIPPSKPGAEGADDAAGRATSLAQARAELIRQGLSGSPQRPRGNRRLLLVTAVILLCLVVLLGVSLAVLGNLSNKISTTTSSVPTGVGTSSTSTTSTTAPAGPPTTGAQDVQAFELASMDEHVLDAVGSGGQPVLLVRTDARSWITAPAPTFVPVVVYLWDGVGCTACAAQNLVVASSLEAIGGTFRGLTRLTSTVGPGTVDLADATYHGPVSFESAELTGADGRPLQLATPEALRQFHLFDRAPFALLTGGLPFLDVGGHFVMVGTGISTSLLGTLTLRQLDVALREPSSPVARAILGNANLLTAAICKSLHQLNRPTPAVCATPVLQGLLGDLPSKAPPGA